MWKFLNECAKGTSHDRTNTVCQDASFVTVWKHADRSVLIITCADGAGTAPKSDVGAAIACKSICSSAADFFEAGGCLGETDQLQLEKWIEFAREQIELAAAEKCISARDMACTLLVAIVSDSSAWLAQIGDGAIVVLHEGEYVPVFWPDSGEYANETAFVTGPAYKKDTRYQYLPYRIDELALTTDGLQRLALTFSTKAVHQPFFQPMFSALRGIENACDLNASLIAFLNSDAVNERTDDDKTLVLATRIGV